MFARLLPILVVAFWISSVAWLCAVVWAPPESRMARVDPREVYEVFFSWNESTNMTLLENGKRRGQITISGGSGPDAESGEFVNSLSLSGVLESGGATNGSREVDLFWRGLVEFTREMGFRIADVSLRVPRRETTLYLALEGVPPTIRARALVNKQEILRYDSAAAAGASPPALPLPLGMLGQMNGLAGLPGIGAVDPAEWKPEVEARMGNLTFGGRDLRAYLLILRAEGKEGAVRLYLSEAGEPLRLETDFGFEAVSEILVPLDAYRKEERPRDKS